jgi:hypothetical protein
MITHKVIFIAAVALGGALFTTPAAEARDHGHHKGNRHHKGHYSYSHYGRSYGGYGQDYYYNQGPPVVYGGPYYYSQPTFGLTFGVGGNRGYRHHHHR